MAPGDVPTSYQTVKEAIREQELARLYNQTHRPATVRPPPTWAVVHARAAQQYPSRKPSASPTHKLGFPRVEDGLTMQPLAITTSAVSSVGAREHAPGSPGSPSSALGGSSKSGLNHTSTYVYGEAPLKPELCTSNQYNMVGSNSMFGSQALSERQSSGAFGFGTSTREQALRQYLSPAHLKASYGREPPAPDTYTLQSSLGRQVCTATDKLRANALPRPLPTPSPSSQERVGSMRLQPRCERNRRLPTPG